MENIIEKKHSYGHLMYAVISVLCPFVAYGVIFLYQRYAYSDSWPPSQQQPLDDAAINSGALMAFVIVVQAIFAVAIGSLIGLVFAGMSLRRKLRILSFGTAALLFNLLPFLVILAMFLRGGR